MSRYRRRYRSAGMERALQHIREAEQLSRELGGTDTDVKEYFFGLSQSQLRPILDEYERRHDKAARDYAERTMPAWRSGRRKMSGQNASRLFDLLPRFMTLERKYGLVESLWERLGAKSEYSVSVGPDADAQSISDVLTRHINATVNEHTIPENLKRRFNWLADGDAQVMQQLLNHFLMRDREQAVEITNAIVALLLPHARNGAAMKGFRRELRIGGHLVHVFFDPRATDVSLRPGSPQYKAAPDYSSIGCLVVLALIALFIWLASR